MESNGIKSQKEESGSILYYHGFGFGFECGFESKL